MKLNKSTHTLEIDEVKAVLLNLIKAQETGNIEKFSSCFAHDTDLMNIGTDIDEIWKGWDEFFTYMKHMVELRKGLKISSRNTKICVAENGNIAWYSQLIDTCIETKSDPFRLEGFRHTGVVQKIDNHWKIVQSHTSVALDEEIDETFINHHQQNMKT